MDFDEKLLEIYLSKSHVEKSASYLILGSFFGVVATILSASSENPLIQKFPVLTIVLVMTTMSLTLLYLINVYREHKWNYQHILIRSILKKDQVDGLSYKELINHIEKVTLFRDKDIKKIIYKHYPPERIVVNNQQIDLDEHKIPKEVIAEIIIFSILFIVTIIATFNA